MMNIFDTAFAVFCIAGVIKIVADIYFIIQINKIIKLTDEKR